MKPATRFTANKQAVFNEMEHLTPDIILYAYRQGVFPMADSAGDDGVHFYRPVMRGLLSIASLHIPKRLARTVRQHPYRVTVNTAFETVIDSCAKQTPRRPKTWINTPIRDAFVAFHRMGHAHSIECWTADGAFAGGIYGLAIGRVFCGESMVSTARDASKIALVHLCARLQAGGFTLLDAQFANDHLKQFGIYEIPQEEYERAIQTDMNQPADFLLKNVDEKTLVAEYLNNRK